MIRLFVENLDGGCKLVYRTGETVSILLGEFRHLRKQQGAASNNQNYQHPANKKHGQPSASS